MALTVNIGKRYRDGRNGYVIQEGSLAFDSSYPTGGEAVTGWNGSNVLGVEILKSGNDSFHYDHVAQKVVAWRSGAEVANTTDLSALNAVRYRLTLR